MNMLQPVAKFLNRRGWETTLVTHLDEAIGHLVNESPDFVLISFNHPNPKVSRLPVFLSQTFNTTSIAFGESLDARTVHRINQSNLKHKITNNVSGPSVQRKIKQILQDIYAPEKEEVVSHRRSSISKAPDLTTVRGAVTNELFKANRGKSRTDMAQDHNRKKMVTDKLNSILGVNKGSNTRKAGVTIQKGGQDYSPKRSVFSSESGEIKGKKKSTKIKGEALDTSEMSEMVTHISGEKAKKSGSIVQEGIKAKKSETYLQKGEKEKKSGSIVQEGIKAKKSETYLQKGEKVKKSGPIVQEGQKSEAFNKSFSSEDSKAFSVVQEGPSLGAKAKGKLREKAAEIESSALYDKDESKEKASPVELAQQYIADGNKSESTKKDDEDEDKGKIIEILSENIKPITKGFSRLVFNAVDIITSVRKEPEQKLKATSNVIVIVVKGSDIHGYLVLSHSMTKDQQVEFSSKIKKHLVSKLSELKKDIELHDPLEVKIPKTEMLKWTEKMGEFTFSCEFDGGEVAVSFIADKGHVPAADSSEGKEKIAIEPLALSPEIRVDFKVYLHLANNEKYFLYINEGKRITEKQRNKLANANKKLYINKSDVKAHNLYCVRHAILLSIEDFKAQVKKDEQSEIAV